MVGSKAGANGHPVGGGGAKMGSSDLEDVTTGIPVCQPVCPCSKNDAGIEGKRSLRGAPSFP